MAWEINIFFIPIAVIATVEIAEAKADRGFDKLPLHQKFWQFLQTFWK